MTDTNKLKELAEPCSMCGGKGYYCEHSTVETCWCVKPTAKEDEAASLPHLVSYAEDLSTCTLTMDDGVGYFFNRVTDQELTELDRLSQEVERLRTRLEISDKHPYDGIDCRDETIKGLERLIQGRWRPEVERLEAENVALRKIISECATACGAGCHPECTLEFMAMLPDEIASVVGKRARNAAIGAVVWQFIDRMTDVCEQDPAERILEQFVAAVRPAIDAALEGGGK